MLKVLLKRSFSNNKSYIHGLSSKPLEYKTITDKFEQITNKYPDFTALISQHQNQKFTYEEMFDQANSIAASLIALGLNPLDRVGIYSPNCSEWYLTQLAASFANLILVNINPAYQKSELKYVLNKVECKALITASRLKSSNYIEMLNSLAPELASSNPGELNSKELPHLKTLIRIDAEKTSGFFNFSDLYELHDSDHMSELNIRKSKQEPDDPCNLQFTSGTTGLPKGAVLSHMNILNNAYFIGERLNYTEKDIICLPVPLYHCFGMVMGNLASLTRGACVVYPSESYNSELAIKAASKYKCTSIYGVPTMFIDYLNEYEKNKHGLDLSNLSKGIIAGALCPKKLMERLINELNLTNLTICYGMTETSPVSFQTKPDDTFNHKVSTVGTILPHLEAKIIDEQGQTVPHNMTGEFCLRGYSVMLKYWNDENATKKTITDNGWIKSGDLATMDEHGFVRIVGRSKDMIIRGGENVYPKEIEEYLMHMPNIEDVQVVGVHDEKFGEEICAILKLKDKGIPFKKYDVLEFCKGKIAHFKIPKYVKVVDSFPLTVTGKPQKFKMREEMQILLKDHRLIEKLKIR